MNLCLNITWATPFEGGVLNWEYPILVVCVNVLVFCGYVTGMIPPFAISYRMISKLTQLNNHLESRSTKLIEKIHDIKTIPSSRQSVVAATVVDVVVASAAAAVVVASAHGLSSATTDASLQSSSFAAAVTAASAHACPSAHPFASPYVCPSAFPSAGPYADPSAWPFVRPSADPYVGLVAPPFWRPAPPLFLRLRRSGLPIRQSNSLARQSPSPSGCLPR
ncbi:putative pectinesterase/pectinesterase inhibitor 28 [Mercurialis annua]|uniref:putative pectinesterase/pectinesterase inhibitor 28 n=1 Tax=Mercurialis annua TaxID=3986 RepID=UPI00215DD9AB|nr:putative pectinesterase/pectinesterase inhibitor 28 [Mercurialis annua]